MITQSENYDQEENRRYDDQDLRPGNDALRR